MNPKEVQECEEFLHSIKSSLPNVLVSLVADYALCWFGQPRELDACRLSEDFVILSVVRYAVRSRGSTKVVQYHMDGEMICVDDVSEQLVSEQRWDTAHLFAIDAKRMLLLVEKGYEREIHVYNGEKWINLARPVASNTIESVLRDEYNIDISCRELLDPFGDIAYGSGKMFVRQTNAIDVCIPDLRPSSVSKYKKSHSFQLPPGHQAIEITIPRQRRDRLFVRTKSGVLMLNSETGVVLDTFMSPAHLRTPDEMRVAPDGSAIVLLWRQSHKPPFDPVAQWFPVFS